MGSFPNFIGKGNASCYDFVSAMMVVELTPKNN